jgi:hypothetical protein
MNTRRACIVTKEKNSMPK